MKDTETRPTELEQLDGDALARAAGGAERVAQIPARNRGKAMDLAKRYCPKTAKEINFQGKTLSQSQAAKCLNEAGYPGMFAGRVLDKLEK